MTKARRTDSKRSTDLRLSCAGRLRHKTNSQCASSVEQYGLNDQWHLSHKSKYLSWGGFDRHFDKRCWHADKHRSRLDRAPTRTRFAVFHKIKKKFDFKAKKHDKIKILANSKLDTISGIVSKAIEDSRVSHQEYQLIIKEVEHYQKIEEEICTKSKKTTDAITAEQREETLKQGREQGKQDFLRKLGATSDILSMPWALNHRLHTICEDTIAHKSTVFTHTPQSLETHLLSSEAHPIIR